MGTTRGIVPLIEELGFDASETLGEAGVPASRFDDPDSTLPDVALGRLLRHLSDRLGCVDVGARLGRDAGLAELGLVGQLAAAAPTVASALASLQRHFGLHDGAGLAWLSLEGPHAVLTYALFEPILEGSVQRLQHASVVGCNLLRELCGPAFAAVEVRLPCRRGPEAVSLARLCRAPLRFECDRAAVVFERAWLERPSANADSDAHERLQRRIEALAAPEPLAVQVRRTVRRLLLEGKAPIEAVASTFSIHRRTLDRWLRASGVSFRELADNVRYEVAKELLQATDLPVTRVAATLHYGDASAFDHAFRRWSGTTPSEWRRHGRGTLESTTR